MYSKDFISYSPEHFIWLAVGVASCVFWIWLGRRQTTELGQQRIGLIQSLVPVTAWIGLSLYMIFFVRPIDLGLVLPFHVCYFINLLHSVMFWRRSFFLFEIT